jgi:hypothetical protein
MPLACGNASVDRNVREGRTLPHEYLGRKRVHDILKGLDISTELIKSLIQEKGKGTRNIRY